jgi:hypothetical protein
MVRWLAIVVVALALWGCTASGPVGVFTASIEPIPGGDVGTIKVAEDRLAAEPEGLTVRADGTFTTMRGGKIVWEGKWRTEGDRLILRATKTNGVDVLPQLQADKSLEMRKDGSIADATTRASGYVLVYRK